MNASGEIKADRFLPVIDEELRDEQMSITKDGKIVIYCNQKGTVYICDSANIKKDYKFLVPFKVKHSDKNSPKVSVTFSNKNEIIFTLCKHDGSSRTKELLMYIITMDGKVKREVQLPITIKHIPDEVSVVFNHFNETILVSLMDGIIHSDNVTIISFLTTGELLHQFYIPRSQCGIPNQLVSNPNGPIALVGCSEGVMLQM